MTPVTLYIASSEDGDRVACYERDGREVLQETYRPEGAWERRVLFLLGLPDAVGARIEAQRKREEP